MLSRHNLTLNERTKVKSDSKGFTAYGFLKVDAHCKPLEPIDTFVKNVNAGDGYGSENKTTNERTVTKITHRLCPGGMKLT